MDSVSRATNSATRSYSALAMPFGVQRKRRCLFSLFASTVFQERHCAPASHCMCRYGTQGRLSFQGCKPPCCTCRTVGWYALSHTHSECRSCRVSLSLPDSRGGYIEQLAKLPLTHAVACISFGITTLPNSFIVMMFLSSFIIVLI